MQTINNLDTSGVYGLLCASTQKWYVGETKNRISDRCGHYARLDCEEQPKLYRAILKYGWNDFTLHVLERLPPIKKILQEREVYWIDKLNSFVDGYNCNPGGYSNCGKSLKGKPKSDSHKKKLSEANSGQGLGRKLSDDTKLRISTSKLIGYHPLRGKSMPNETRKKISNAHRGRIRTEEHQLKLNRSHTGKTRSAESKRRMSVAAKLAWQRRKGNL